MTQPGGGGFGGGPYGGGSYGGAIPPPSPFDLFCFDHCVPMLGILSDLDVSTVGSGSHFVIDGPSCDLIIGSGGTLPVTVYPTTDAQLIVTTSVPQQFTLQWTARFDALPPDFLDLVNKHIFVGTTDAAGPCAGLFISQLGIMYAGGVHHSGGDMVLDSTTQIIPGSNAYINTGEYITFRMSVSLATNNVYIFVTRTSEIATTGQILRAVVPAIPASALAFPPTDRTLVTVRGTALESSVLSLDELCLSSAVLIPNLLPVADAGLDQAIRACSIAQLDGGASFDPEGASLAYLWRLIDAPLGSAFSVELKDGATFPIDATDFTNKFHSAELSLIDAADPILAGDVLLHEGIARTVVSTGVDGNGFHLLFASQDIAEPLSSQPFKVLRQRGISGVTTENPTFFPDIPGFYRFDLVVNDGALGSSPSVTILNVLESPLPRGCTPNLNFLFSYLSDFWQLVEDREPIAEFWGALAQVAATELYTLWQIEYSKSLRDVQRSFVRRWIHYDPLLPEPIPELTSIRALWGGVESGLVISSGAPSVQLTTLVISSPIFDTDFSYTFSGLDPFSTVDIQAELLPALRLKDSRFTIQQLSTRNQVAATGTITSVARSLHVDGNTITISDGSQSITLEVDTVPDGVAPGNVAMDVSLFLPASLLGDIIRDTINAQNVLGNINITASGGGALVNLVNDNTGEGGNVSIVFGGGMPGSFTGMSGGVGGDYFRIDAPFPFTTSVDSTFPTTILAPFGTNEHPQDTSGGAGVGSTTYKVSRSLEGLDIQENDFLSVAGQAFRIARVVDDANDEFSFQRIVVKETLPTAPATAWDVSGWVRSEFLDFYNGLVAVDDAIFFESVDTVGDFASTLATDDILSTRVLGVNEVLAGHVAIDITPIGEQISKTDELVVRFAKVVRRTYVPVDSLVQDIPTLSEKVVLLTVDDETAVLRRNLDFFLGPVRNGQGIRFVADLSQATPDVWEGDDPPDRLWAEYTFLDNRPTIEGNFGIPAEFTLDQHDELPVDVDYLSAVRGLWYSYLNGPTIRNLRIGSQILLGLPFAEAAGTIEEIRTDFSPNEGRILIRDTVNPEIVRSYTFPNVLGIETNPETKADYVVGDTVRQFVPLVEGVEVVDYIKDPTWFEGLLNQGIFFEVEKFFRFLIRVNSDAFNLAALLFVRNFILKIKPTYTFPLFLVQKEIGDTEVSTTDDIQYTGRLILTDTPCDGWLGSSTLWDDPRAGGGGWRNDYDANADPDDADPIFPTADSTILWAYDKAYLCPDDPISFICCTTILVASTVSFDSCLSFDTPITANYTFQEAAPIIVPAGPGGLALTAASPVTAPFTGTLDEIRVILDGGPGADPDAYEFIITVNAVDQPAVTVTSLAGSTESRVTGLAIAVTIGDTIGCRVRPTVGGPNSPAWVTLTVDLFQADATVWTFGASIDPGRYCQEFTP